MSVIGIKPLQNGSIAIFDGKVRSWLNVYTSTTSPGERYTLKALIQLISTLQTGLRHVKNERVLDSEVVAFTRNIFAIVEFLGSIDTSEISYSYRRPTNNARVTVTKIICSALANMGSCLPDHSRNNLQSKMLFSSLLKLFLMAENDAIIRTVDCITYLDALSVTATASSLETENAMTSLIIKLIQRFLKSPYLIAKILRFCCQHLESKKICTQEWTSQPNCGVYAKLLRMHRNNAHIISAFNELMGFIIRVEEDKEHIFRSELGPELLRILHENANSLPIYDLRNYCPVLTAWAGSHGLQSTSVRKIIMDVAVVLLDRYVLQSIQPLSDPSCTNALKHAFYATCSILMALVIYDNDAEGRQVRNELVGEHYWVGMTNWVCLKKDLEKSTIGISFVHYMAPLIRFAIKCERSDLSASLLLPRVEESNETYNINPLTEGCSSNSCCFSHKTCLVDITRMIRLLCWSLRCMLFTGYRLTNQLKAAGMLRQLGYLLLGIEKLREKSVSSRLGLCALNAGQITARNDSLRDCIIPALLTLIQLARVTAREPKVLALPTDKADTMLCCEAAIACARSMRSDRIASLTAQILLLLYHGTDYYLFISPPPLDGSYWWLSRRWSFEDIWHNIRFDRRKNFLVFLSGFGFLPCQRQRQHESEKSIPRRRPSKRTSGKASATATKQERRSIPIGNGPTAMLSTNICNCVLNKTVSSGPKILGWICAQLISAGYLKSQPRLSRGKESQSCSISSCPILTTFQTAVLCTTIASYL